ncbi:MAG: glycosyltransferase, partial [Nitrososphaeria archaeon]
IDGSRDVIASSLEDKRVHYIYQSHKGFSAAINRGIKEADGDLIGFIGQDDLWLSNKLEIQVKFFEKHPDVDLVCSNYFLINAKGQITGVTNTEIPKVSSREKLIEKLFLENFIGFETVLVKKECFYRVGFFDENMVGFSDHDMWLRIAGEFNINGFIEKPLVMKREHELQLSKVKINDVLKDEFIIIKKAITYYPFLRKSVSKKLASLYYKRGVTLLQKGDIQGAKEQFLKVIKYQPWKYKAIIAYIVPILYRFILNTIKRYTGAP